MAEEFANLNEEERIKAENEYLKMKLMLENGARFGIQGKEELPPDVENTFLKNIIEFERQFEQQKMIKVFDKVERPSHFKPVAEIPEEKIKTAYNGLTDYLEKYGIYLDVCSPNISTREMYRFVVEELFEYEMDDIAMPGWTHSFVYDEFHPDPVYDNSMAAKQCLREIFRTTPIDFDHSVRPTQLQLNDRENLNEKELSEIVDRFKSFYEKLELEECEVDSCMIDEKITTVKGKYKAIGITARDKPSFSGNWEMKFECDADSGYWNIYSIVIEGIQF